jgi:EAL domain-containing protein (putative c-di-GMP-specific phosphodiesterase class I)
VELGRTLQLRTVAEGLENTEQVRLLQAMGCDRGQGFVFARPMPADAITQLFTENQVEGRPCLAPSGSRLGTG